MSTTSSDLSQMPDSPRSIECDAEQGVLVQDRDSFFPVVCPEVYQAYKDMQAKHWVAEEIDFSRDRRDWISRLNKDEQFYLSNILSLFSKADDIVTELLGVRLGQIKLPEARMALSLQMAFENVHVETYGQQIITVIEDPEEREKILNAALHNPIVQPKLEWSKRWITTSCPLAQCLVAHALLEGVGFASSFAGIFSMRDRNLLPGLIQSNELIARDETDHWKLACILFRLCEVKPEVSTIRAMVEDMMEIEDQFVRECMPVDLIQINPREMMEHVRCCVDMVLMELGYAPMYGAKPSPFKFMSKPAMQRHEDFFGRKTVYNVAPSRMPTSIKPMTTAVDFD